MLGTWCLAMVFLLQFGFEQVTFATTSFVSAVGVTPRSGPGSEGRLAGALAWACDLDGAGGIAAGGIGVPGTGAGGAWIRQCW